MSEREAKVLATSIFLKAADYIRRYGWQVKGMGQYGKPRCSMGALESAYPRKKWDKTLAPLMYEALYKELNGINLTQFNHKHKNGEKVAQLYEQVAYSLDFAGKNTTA